MVIKDRMNMETIGLGLCALLHDKCVSFASLGFHFPFMKVKTIIAFLSPRIVESGWEGKVLWLEFGLYTPRLRLRFSPQRGSVGKQDLVGLPGLQVELSRMALCLSLLPSHFPRTS